MKHTLETINGLSILAFDGTATNHADAREGSALAMVKYANDNSIGGFDDWVLPTRETLLELCQLLNGSDKEVRWSASPYVGNSNYAWVVDFSNGYVYGSYRNGGYYVRLVRASQLFDIGQLSLNKRFGAIKGVQR
jgi:hypothetical protein